MFNRGELKKSARHSLKKHYWIFVIACVIAAFIGTEYTSSLSSLTTLSPAGIAEKIGDAVVRFEQDGTNAVSDYLKEQYISTDTTASTNTESKNIGAIEIGFSDGVFASIANSLMSGKYISVIFAGINSIIGSESAAVTVMVIGSMLILLAVWIFISNVFAVTLRRIILEGHIYDKVHYSRLLFLQKSKKWFKASISMLVLAIYQALWSLTIVGGIIKAYSYRLTPYIIAENPDISPNEAITLSRRMMKGHKWECFVFDLSFLPWDLLKLVTFGIVDVFFINPYKQATYGEYYVYLRKLAIQGKLKGHEKLIDTYLYEKAPENELSKAYADISDIKNNYVAPVKQSGVRGFFENVFGVVLSYDERDNQYESSIEDEMIISDYDDVLKGLSYPSRLSPIPEKQKNRKIERSHYMRHYSVTSLIFIFFITCFIGWIFEVAQHIIEDGTFINRGFMYGPWLPIYGSGCVMILMLLYRLRRHPIAEFVVTVLLCGVVEYTTGFLLEITHNGQRWWDYTGYFLNINGRVCAEGLLVFGLGGVFIVYIAAPLIDNLLKKIPKKTAGVIAAILALLFIFDLGCSIIKPNSGRGITDYEITKIYSD